MFLSPTLSGLIEMLKLCDDYALKHEIIFNASKSQLLYFLTNTTRARATRSYIIIWVILFVATMTIDNAITDMNMRLNHLLAEF